MHILGSSWELALLCVVAPNPASLVRPVASCRSLPRQGSGDIRERDMEIHINKTTRSLGTRALQSWCFETVHSSMRWEDRAEPCPAAVSFAGKGDSNVIRVFFSGVGVVSSASLLQDWQKQRQKQRVSKGLRRVCSVFFCGLCIQQQEGL